MRLHDYVTMRLCDYKYIHGHTFILSVPVKYSYKIRGSIAFARDNMKLLKIFTTKIRNDSTRENTNCGILMNIQGAFDIQLTWLYSYLYLYLRNHMLPTEKFTEFIGLYIYL